MLSTYGKLSYPLSYPSYLCFSKHWLSALVRPHTIEDIYRPILRLIFPLQRLDMPDLNPENTDLTSTDVTGYSFINKLKTFTCKCESF